jgi:hypothetical protein
VVVALLCERSGPDRQVLKLRLVGNEAKLGELMEELKREKDSRCALRQPIGGAVRA